MTEYIVTMRRTDKEVMCVGRRMQATFQRKFKSSNLAFNYMKQMFIKHKPIISEVVMVRTTWAR